MKRERCLWGKLQRRHLEFVIVKFWLILEVVLDAELVGLQQDCRWRRGYVLYLHPEFCVSLEESLNCDFPSSFFSITSTGKGNFYLTVIGPAPIKIARPIGGIWRSSSVQKIVVSSRRGMLKRTKLCKC